jgi:hypothetical protein
MKGTIMMRRFGSAGHFFRMLFDIFRGPSIVMTWFRVKPRFRERLLLAVTVANNCYS